MKNKNKQKKLVIRRVSKCCGAKISNNVIMKKNQESTGTIVYFVCSICKRPCNTKIIKVWVDEDNMTPSSEPNRFDFHFKNP